MSKNATSTGGAASDTTFVEKIWKEAGASFAPIAAEVDGEPCLITSVTARPAGSAYVNLTVGDEKRSLIAANHTWIREQKEINDSAFFGVLRGAPADATLRYEAPPKTIAEARAKNRAETVGKSYFLKCKEGENAGSWRLVSGVEFGHDYLDAISHFDWGEKQRFSFNDITEIVSLQTNEKLSIDDMREDLELRPMAPKETQTGEKSPLRLIALFIAAAVGAGAVSYFLLDRFLPPAKAPISSAKAPQSDATEGVAATASPASEPRASDKPATVAPAASQPPVPAAPVVKKSRDRARSAH